MQATGKVKSINNELDYGFISVPKVGDVFFSKKSSYSGLAFEDLIVGAKVQLEVVDSARGLFAKTVSQSVSNRPKRQPEASL